MPYISKVIAWEKEGKSRDICYVWKEIIYSYNFGIRGQPETVKSILDLCKWMYNENLNHKNEIRSRGYENVWC